MKKDFLGFNSQVKNKLSFVQVIKFVTKFAYYSTLKSPHICAIG